MEVLYFLVPLALLLGIIGLGLMLWALKSGQFEDLEGPAHRVLFDDDREMIPHQGNVPPAASTPPATPAPSPPPATPAPPEGSG